MSDIIFDLTSQRKVSRYAMARRQIFVEIKSPLQRTPVAATSGHPVSPRSLESDVLRDRIDTSNPRNVLAHRDVNATRVRIQQSTVRL